MIHISARIREERLGWLGHVERRIEEYTTENMESGSESLLKEGKTKTNVEGSEHYY